MNKFFGYIPKPQKENVKTPCVNDDRFFTNVKKKKNNNQEVPIKPKLNANGEYDIIALHLEVLNRLIEKSRVVVDNEKDIKIQEWISQNNPDPTERRLAEERLFQIRNNINRKDLKSEYETRASKLIERYKELCSTPIEIDFLKRTKTVKKEIEHKKKILAEEFISVCQEYVPIFLTMRFDTNMICCENTLIVCEDGVNFCSSCGEIPKSIDHTGAFKDQKRVSSNTRQKYYNVKHFSNTTQKVQGRHKKHIPGYVYEECDRYRERHKMDKEDFTIHDLNHVLNLNKKLSCFYKDIHLIYKEYTGKQLIDLSDVEDGLVDKYVEQDKLSDEFKLKDDSKNSINATYMCCRLSQISGRTDLRMELFFCTKTEETIKKYDEVVEARFRKLGWLLEGEKFEDVCR